MFYAPVIPWAPMFREHPLHTPNGHNHYVYYLEAPPDLALGFALYFFI